MSDVVKTIMVRGAHSSWTATVDDDQVTLADPAATFIVTSRPDGRFQVEGTSGTNIASAVRVGDAIWVGIDGHVLELHIGADAAAAHPAARDADSLAPLMPATVVKIHVRPGDRVQEGDTLVTLEAMKMEMPIRAPRAATIAAVHCLEGTLAEAGKPVVTLS